MSGEWPSVFFIRSADVNWTKLRRMCVCGNSLEEDLFNAHSKSSSVDPLSRLKFVHPRSKTVAVVSRSNVWVDANNPFVLGRTTAINTGHIAGLQNLECSLTTKEFALLNSSFHRLLYKVSHLRGINFFVCQDSFFWHYEGAITGDRQTWMVWMVYFVYVLNTVMATYSYQRPRLLGLNFKK